MGHGDEGFDGLPGYDEWKTRSPDDEPERQEGPCPTCEGSGRVPYGEHFVTRDMAIDAGEPNMEGQSMGVEYSPCPECGGYGVRP